MQALENVVGKLPLGFVYLRDVIPGIIEEMRYFGHYNFVGRPIAGYNAPLAIMTETAANALKKVQEDLEKFGLNIKIYDAYRPQVAVDDFYEWSQDESDQVMKVEFYPRIEKREIFERGYLIKKSGHSRGSTVDLTIVPNPIPDQKMWASGDPILDGALPFGQRQYDNSIDMGSSFDCLDEVSHTFNKALPAHVKANRMLLRTLMEKHGFRGIDCEWWHFTLVKEPYPDTYFNFPVE